MNQDKETELLAIIEKLSDALETENRYDNVNLIREATMILLKYRRAVK